MIKLDAIPRCLGKVIALLQPYPHSKHHTNINSGAETERKLTRPAPVTSTIVSPRIVSWLPCGNSGDSHSVRREESSIDS